jgi:sulfonate transport system substrate-binding protein
VKVAVNPTTIESAPIFVAGDRLGGAVELIGGKIPLLLDGTADAATNAETQALLYSLREPRLRIILTVAECSYRVIARRSRGINSPADLRAKTIGTTRHTSAHYYLVQLAATAGIREADLKVIDVPQAEMPAALERGAVDALSIWEPIAEAAAVRLGPDAAIFQDGALFRERFNLNTTTEVLDDRRRRAELVDFIRALIAAAAHTRDSPTQVWPLLASKISLSEATIARLWPQFRFPASLPEDLPQLAVAEERWLAASQKRAARSAKVIRNLIDGSVLAEAMAR